MPLAWTPSSDCPQNVDDLRVALKALAKKNKGKLISEKFKTDHLFVGHTDGDPKKLAAALARLRNLERSTLMTGDLTGSALAEVNNWIESVPGNVFTLNGGTWTVSNRGTTVPATKAYKFSTVDLDELRGMDGDDVVKKARKWLKESLKRPAVACQFAADGTPQIYHLDY